VNQLLQTTRTLLDTSLDPVQRDHVHGILTEAEAALDHIDDLLDYINIEAGRLEVQQIDFDLRVMMDGVTRSLSLRARDRGITLSCRVHHAVPALLRGDPGRLRQVITSLVGHAIRRGRDGDVTLQVAVASETEDTVTLRFAVTLPGGVAPAPAGLGMALAGHLARMMRGDIGQQPGLGGLTSWFTAVLERQDRSSLDESIGAIASQRVLVVCDDATTRVALSRRLEGWGCRHVEAFGGDGALAQLHAAVQAGDPFQVVLVDLAATVAELENLGREINRDPVLESTQLVLITAVTQRGDAARMSAAGYVAYLTKTVRSSELHTCLAAIAGGAHSAGIITQHALAERRKHSLRILVVEHNPVNCMLTLRILERLGYHAEAVTGSADAVSVLTRERRDLLLIDVQLPERDGVMTARLIRDPSSAVRQHGIPIIGITTRDSTNAPALCIAAGMNDCLLRPVESDVVSRAIDKLVGESRPPLDGAGARTSALFNRRELLERLDGDEDLCRDVLRTFLRGAVPLLKAVRDSVKRSDRAGVQRSAHTLMDAAANVTAEGVRSLAYRIEHAGRSGQLMDASALTDQLERLLNLLGEHVSLPGGEM